MDSAVHIERIIKQTETGLTSEEIYQILRNSEILFDENCDLRQEVVKLRETLKKVRSWIRGEINKLEEE